MLKKTRHDAYISFLLCLAILTLLTFQSAVAAAPTLIISEIMADNNGTILDEDGTEADWLEIHNQDVAPASLTGYYLTDDPLELDKWQFPAVTLNAGDYLLVFASGKNRDVGELHTNFNLNTEGEYLALVKPDGVTIAYEFAPTYAPQKKGLSYGTPEGTAALAYFQTPTPNTANNTSYYEGLVSDIQFSHTHGFYDAPFNLTLSTTPAATTIRYTLDGSPPTETHGTIYSSPISINQTSIIRAVAYQTNYISATMTTQTYVFLNDVVTQYANGTPPAGWPANKAINNQEMNYGMDPDIVPGLYSTAQVKNALQAIPSLSIVTDLNNLFDPTTGIFVNAWDAHGGGWERPTSLELIYPDGSAGFQINAGLRIRGGYSRISTNPKRAFRFFFRAEYGDSKLRYPLFGEYGTDTFDKLDLRTAQNYSWSYDNSNQNTFLREIFSRDLQRDIGQPYTRSEYYHLYINGVYWGLFMTQERADAAYAESYFGGQRADYDTLKSTGGNDDNPNYSLEVTDGTVDEWQTLWNLSRAQFDNPTFERYMQMQGLNVDGTRNPGYPVLLDVDSLIDYMLIIFYTGNFDAPLSAFIGASNNWYAIRNRETDNQGFIFFAHDAEHSLGVRANVVSNQTTTLNRVGPLNMNQQDSFDKSNPQFLHQDLWGTEEYVVHFGDRVHKYFFNGGPLTPSANTARIEARRQIVEAVIVAEAARWGDSKRMVPFNKTTWENEVAILTDTYLPVRSDIVLQQLIDAGLYPSLEAPTYNQHGGLVSPNFNLTMTTFPTGTVYYTTDGSDPRLTGGAINPNASIYSGGNVVLNQDATVKARQWAAGQWSALNEADFIINNAVPAAATNLVISEINYNPTDEADNWEYLEFKNVGSQKIDLAGVTISGAVDFTFPQLSLLQPGEYVLIVEDTNSFNDRYATNTLSPWYEANIHVAGSWSGNLSNGGEEIIVTAANNAIIMQFAYNDSGSWSTRADGYGSTLELTDPAAVPTTQPERNNYLADGNNWRPTSEYHGSPGRAGLGPDNRIAINEILANSLTISDTIELYNTTATPVAMGGWFLSDDRDDYKKYRLPAGTEIAAAGFHTISATAFDNASDPHTFAPFGLSSTDGDDIYLLQADNLGNLQRFVEHVEFGATVANTTIGRLPDGQGDFYRMCQNTLGQSNTAAGNTICHGPVVINEIHYNPDGADDNREFIELYNFGNTAESLANWRLRGEVDYNFAEGISLAPHEALLIVAFNPADSTLLNNFHAAYNVAPNVQIVGPWAPTAAKLDDGGATVKLYRAGELVVSSTGSPYYAMLTEDVATYDDEGDWPATADGAGASLELINPLLDNRPGSSWTASRTAKGTPGRHNDDDYPGITINNATAIEGATVTAVEFTVTLEHSSDLPVTVAYTTADGSAMADSDYTLQNGTLTFNTGETSKTISILLNNDTLSENTETFTVNLGNPLHGYLLNNQGVGTIYDDETLPTITAADVTVSEGTAGTTTTAIVHITLSHPSASTITAAYNTITGTATAADYEEASGTVTFTPGQTTTTVSLTIKGDDSNEADETFTLHLANPSNALIGKGVSTITIHNAPIAKVTYTIAIPLVTRP